MENNITKNSLAVVNSIDDLGRLGTMFMKSGMFEGVTDVAKASVKIMAGQELGIAPFASMTGIHIIKGKPCLSANAMAAVIKRSGKYTYRIKTMTDEKCEIEFLERMDGKWECIGVSTFDIKDAQKAGTQNLQKFPRNMLFARAMSNGAKWNCPDLFIGGIYVPEEMGVEVNEEGEPIDGDLVDTPHPVEAPVEVIEAEVVEEPKNVEEKKTTEKKSDFDEETALRNFIQPRDVTPLVYDSESVQQTKDSKDVLYVEKSTQKLFESLNHIQLWLQKTGISEERKADMLFRKSVVCSIILYRKANLK